MKNFKKFALSFTQQNNTFGQGRDEYSSYEERRQRDSDEAHDERERDEREHDETNRRDVNGGDSGTPPSDDE